MKTERRPSTHYFERVSIFSGEILQSSGAVVKGGILEGAMRRTFSWRFWLIPIRTASLVWVLLAARASAQAPLDELFQKGKAEFRKAAWEASLETFRRLDEASRAPGFEAARAKLEPILAFYRGANLAALGKKEEARLQFEKYLAAVPNARLDPAMFPKAVIEAFDKAREQAPAPPPDAPAAGDTGMANEYAHFFPDERDGPSAFPDERWALGPIRYFMTKEEKLAFQALQSTAERVEFVHRFWQRRNPAQKEEFERRLRFADMKFKQDETRGTETDRGLVFVLLGPPSYVGQSPLRPEDDPMQVSRNAPTSETVRNADGSTSTLFVPRVALSAKALQGIRETWHYRRDRLPKEVRFTEVNFEFHTKDGAGVGVLQRGHDVLMTLEAVAKTMHPKE
jgi:GWxTD domain-containing protein